MGEAHTCHMLFLSSVHIKELSGWNTLRTLIYHGLLWRLLFRWREESRGGDLVLVRYSGRSLSLIHIHSSFVPHVCPALKKTNTRYPSLSSKSPLSPHYPSFIPSAFIPFIYIQHTCAVCILCVDSSGFHRVGRLEKVSKAKAGSFSVCVRGIFS